MRDQLLALHIPQRVLELHQLNEQVVLRIELGRVHRRLVVEGQPFLDARHARPLREVEKERRVEHDRRRQNAVAAQEVDLQLHRVAEPSDQIDVVPALFVVTARGVVIDPHHVAQVFVELRVELWLKDVVERRLLAFFLRLERLRDHQGLRRRGYPGCWSSTSP